MSLDLVVGKAVPPQETVGLRPDPERVPTPDEVDEASMPEGDLERMLQALRRRSRRMAVTGGTPGPGRVVTERSLLTGE
jgi:hypothetical protein